MPVAASILTERPCSHRDAFQSESGHFLARAATGVTDPLTVSVPCFAKVGACSGELACGVRPSNSAHS